MIVIFVFCIFSLERNKKFTMRRLAQRRRSVNSFLFGFLLLDISAAVFLCCKVNTFGMWRVYMIRRFRAPAPYTLQISQRLNFNMRSRYAHVVCANFVFVPRLRSFHQCSICSWCSYTFCMIFLSYSPESDYGIVVDEQIRRCAHSISHTHLLYIYFSLSHYY